MAITYVDTSCLVAVLFGEPGSDEVADHLASRPRLVSSNLLEAELRATLVRESLIGGGESLLASIAWVLPDRALTPELKRTSRVGYIRGADMWHLACALYLSPDPKDLAFATLDSRQGEIAKRLGFKALI